MSKKYRTQLLLEEEQYRYLKSIAQRDGISMSEALRQILSQFTISNYGAVRERLQSIEGIGEDREISGKEHDSVLYKQP
ncbi:MAG: hypothetical protein DDT21_00506 [Syntrophomonadaceae bacterium]|nr:hypothetical protein [Bacillota bacterium]